MSCEWKWKFDGRKCNSDQWWNNEKRHVCEKDYVWNPAICSCENGKYLANIMDDSANICDEVIDADRDAEAKSNNKAKPNDETKTVPTNFNEKNITSKTKNSIFYLHFY